MEVYSAANRTVTQLAEDIEKFNRIIHTDAATLAVIQHREMAVDAMRRIFEVRAQLFPPANVIFDIGHLSGREA
jgi:hypothetical protein